MSPSCYRSLLPAVLLVFLAGCSSDQPATTGRPAVSAQPAAPATGQPVTTPAAAALAPVAGRPALRPQLPATAASAASPGLVGAAHTTQWVRRSPGALPPAASIPAAPTPQQALRLPAKVQSCDLLPQAPSPVAAPIAAANDLAAFCAQAAPLRQVFRVRPGRDTVLLGEQGTRLVVPGRAFDVPANSGPVQLELQEFYATPDIILANLSTATGASLLETGGMLHLQATVAGQPVVLRPGAKILLQLPTRERKPGMQLYQGVASAAHPALDWQLPSRSSSTSGSIGDGPGIDLAHPKGGRWPRFTGRDNSLLTQYDRLMSESKADLARVKRTHLTAAQKRQLRELSRQSHMSIMHAIFVDLLVDSTGVSTQPELRQGDSVLGKRLVALVAQLPRQRPASFLSPLPHHGRTISSARGVLSVLYARNGKRLVGITWLMMPRYLSELAEQEARRGRAEFARQFSKNTPLSLGNGLSYELVAGGLGWINCDRLLEPGPRIEFAVQAPGPATVVSLVFKDQRSILASSRTEGSRAIFEQVPDGAAATVVALRRENGITYLATSGLNLRPDAQPALQFHPVSLDELRTELARL